MASDRMWRVELTKKARKRLLKLPGDIRENIVGDMRRELSVDPDFHLSRLSGCKGNLYKFRVGDYRVLCAKREEKLVVVAVAAGRRKDIYGKRILN